MKICWFKDSKIGHEKQVHAILDNLALSQDLLIEERYISNPVWLELLLYLLKIIQSQTLLLALVQKLQFLCFDIKLIIKQKLYL